MLSHAKHLTQKRLTVMQWNRELLFLNLVPGSA